MIFPCQGRWRSSNASRGKRFRARTAHEPPIVRFAVFFRSSARAEPRGVPSVDHTSQRSVVRFRTRISKASPSASSSRTKHSTSYLEAWLWRVPGLVMRQSLRLCCGRWLGRPRWPPGDSSSAAHSSHPCGLPMHRMIHCRCIRCLQAISDHCHRILPTESGMRSLTSSTTQASRRATKIARFLSH